MFFLVKKKEFLLVMLPSFTYAFLYDEFVDSINDYKHKIINLKSLFKQYWRFQTLTSDVLIIFTKLFFGIDFIVVGTMKFQYISLNQMMQDYTIPYIILGVLIIISFVSDIIAFNK